MTSPAINPDIFTKAYEAARGLIREEIQTVENAIANLTKGGPGSGPHKGGGKAPQDRKGRRISNSQQPFDKITKDAITRSGNKYADEKAQASILKEQIAKEIAGNMRSSTKDLGVSGGRLRPSDVWENGAPKKVEDAIREEAVSNLVRQWAFTSNDSEPSALAMQQAAVEEFGIKGHAEWTEASDSIMGRAQENFGEHGEVYKDFLRTQYDATQAEFAKQGIGPNDTFLLYRGVNYSLPDEGEKFDAQLRPMSSFSTDPGVARAFSQYGDFFATEVKASDILSMPATGNGCLNEREMVVLGGVKESTVVSLYPDYSTGLMHVQGLPDTASATKAAKQTINVDNNLTNSDWIKTGSWGFPDISDLPSYALVNRINLKATFALSDRLKTSMTLPSWTPAPQKLKSEAQAFLEQATKGGPGSGPRPHGGGGDWKPTMTRAEADKWAKNSAIKGPLYHGTTNEAAQSIKEKGFDIARAGTQSGQSHGKAVYLSDSQAKADKYSTRAQGQTLETRVNVQNPAGLKETSAVIAAAVEKSGGYESQKGGYTDQYARAVVEEAQRRGYDALTGPLGKTERQIIVFDPEKIVTVK